MYTHTLYLSIYVQILDIESSANMDSNDETLPEYQDFHPIETLKLPPNKESLTILILGKTKHGKSSLVNDLLGYPMALIEPAQKRRKDNSVEAYQTAVGKKCVIIYEAQGLGGLIESDRKVLRKLEKELEGKTFDIVLICYKLFDAIDVSAKESLEKIMGYLGNDLISNTIIVLTFADQYITQCRAVREYHERSEEETLELVKREMIDHVGEMKAVFKTLMVGKSMVPEELFDTIPFRLSSSEMRSLPVNEDWIQDLWDKCIELGENKSKPLVGFIGQHRMKIAGVGGTVAATAGVGVTTGIIIGGLCGSVVPGPGTIIGATIGGFIGGGIGTAVGGVGGGIAAATIPIVKEKLLERSFSYNKQSKPNTIDEIELKEDTTSDN